jgi:hypothetical protein
MEVSDHIDGNASPHKLALFVPFDQPAGGYKIDESLSYSESYAWRSSLMDAVRGPGRPGLVPV